MLPARCALALAVLSGLVAVTAPPASARSCAPISGHIGYATEYAHTDRGSADVEIYRGHVACSTARRIARRALLGHPKYVDNGYTANSYYLIGGWKGDIRMGVWIFSKGRSRIGGDIYGICPDGRKVPTATTSGC